MNVDILLSAHNGARTIGTQIESLFRQTSPNWRLLGHDNSSTDNTATALKLMAREHPDKIILLPEKAPCLSETESHSALLKASDAPYIMFCEQDGIWHPEKIERQLEALHEMESLYGAHTPLLVHTDARIVDSDLRPLHNSSHATRRFQPTRASLPQLLMQNIFHPGTLAMNRALVELALPIPSEARDYTHWLALVAAAAGHIRYLDLPLADRREAVLPKRRWYHPTQLKRRVFDTMAANISQAQALERRLSSQLSLKQHELLLLFTGLPNTPPGRRHLRMMRYGFLRQPWKQNLPVMWYY